MPKYLELVSPRDGRRVLVSFKMANLLLRRGWTADPQQYQTRHMEAANVSRERTELSDPLAGVRFANKVAREAAMSAGLSAAAFDGTAPTGSNGGFTKPDVLEIVKCWA